MAILSPLRNGKGAFVTRIAVAQEVRSKTGIRELNSIGNI